MLVDLDALERAVLKLKEGLQLQAQASDSDIIRDGLIQRFEFTYELAHKTLRRFLAVRSPNTEDVLRMDFPTLIRIADEQGLLLGGWPKWKVWRELRGKSSHTYDENIALEVVAGIPEFYEEAAQLLTAMGKAGQSG